jgi:hypothetical protein
MPEMVRFCGRRLTVQSVAHKLCDTIERSGFRRMERAVHLVDARCDGSAHGGCQTECLLYWKEAWLRRVEDEAEPSRPSPTPESNGADPAPSSPILLPLLVANTSKEPGPDGEERYACQATELLRAAPRCLPVRELGQYVEDVRSGNASPAQVVRAFLIAVFNGVQRYSVRFLPARMQFRGGRRWYFLAGTAVGRTPTTNLGLQPGELVRIKSKEEILPTLDRTLRNRGLGFDEEISEHCGKIARVRARAERVVDEKSGRLLTMKNPCIVLDDIVCEGGYSQNCPRRFYSFWREIWLERVGEPDS